MSDWRYIRVNRSNKKAAFLCVMWLALIVFAVLRDSMAVGVMAGFGLGANLTMLGDDK